MHVDGRCLCGGLQYEAEVDPASGFRFIRGEPKTFVKVADSGNRRVLAFCPTCGTSINSRLEDGKEGYFGLRIGSLRQRDQLLPRTQCWRRSAQRWVDRIKELPASEGDELPPALI